MSEVAVRGMDSLFLEGEDGMRGFCLSRGVGDVYERQLMSFSGGARY